MDIGIEKNSIKQYGATILDLSKQLDSEIKHYNQIIESLEQHWIGESANAYFAIIKKQNIESLQELQELLQLYGIYLKEVPGAYDLLDSIFVKKPV